MILCLPHFSFLSIVGAIDKCDVCKSLWVVAQSIDPVVADLFGKQAKVSGITEQPLKERACFIDSTLHGKVVDQPEGTDGEGTFTSRQSIIGVVAIDEAICICQALADAIDRRAHARVIRCYKADQG